VYDQEVGCEKTPIIVKKILIEFKIRKSIYYFCVGVFFPIFIIGFLFLVTIKSPESLSYAIPALWAGGLFLSCLLSFLAMAFLNSERTEDL